MATIQLIPATQADYPIIYNLARFYAYDISEFFADQPGWEMEDDGLYGVGVDYNTYFTNPESHPFLIRYKGELAGFVMVDKDSIDPGAEFNMAQFFILRTYKRKGLGRYIATECFAQFKGAWEVHVLPENTIAYHFWRSVISQFTHNNFHEIRLKNKEGEERIAFEFSSIKNS